MRRPIAAALLLSTSLGVVGCTTNSGVQTTPTFAAARYVPDIPGQPTTAQLRQRQAAADAQRALPTNGVSVSYPPEPQRKGAATVAATNRAATVQPTSATLQGASWIIDTFDPRMIYQVNLAPKRATTLLLPSGERFNGAVGGDVEAFLINVSYGGPRPAVSILPRSGAARGNLQLITTGGFYSFDLQVGGIAINLVDIGHQLGARKPISSGGQLPGNPQPEGDFTRLSMTGADGHLPAWAPAEAWADSYKMVIRFASPLPVMPSLQAGQKGEQIVDYHVVTGADGAPSIVTSRRVTEAQLRVDKEIITITVDPDAIGSGSAADPAKGADGWRTSEALPDKPAAAPSTSVAVFMINPAQLATMPAGSFTPGTNFNLEQPAAVAPQPAQQPMANGIVHAGGI